MLLEIGEWVIMKKPLIVIPAYNEECSIVHVVENIVNNFKQYDYIVVNDGSSDRTGSICKEKGYNCINLSVNLGLGNAIRSGMLYAQRHDYDKVIQIDADGQHLPEYIELMLKKMEETSADIVIGSRYVSNKKPISIRMIGSRIIAASIRLTTCGKRIEDVTSGMRMFNRRMIEQYCVDMHYSPEPDTLAYLLNCGVYIEEVQVEMRERFAGKSYLNNLASFNYMLRMLFSILIFQWVRVRVKGDK